MNVKLINIPGDEDSAKNIINADTGEHLGTVARGWLRLGGNQWVATLRERGQFGARTLKEITRAIEFKLSR